MRARTRLSRGLLVLAAFLLLLVPAPAFAHDNLGGDELAVANWMLIAAIVVAGLAALALIWAIRSGQFSNVEDSKYTMLELSDDYDAIMAQLPEQEKKRPPRGKGAVSADLKAAEPAPQEPLVKAAPTSRPAGL